VSMMRLKKVVAVALTAVMTCGLLSSCQGSSSSSTGSTATTSSSGSGSSSSATATKGKKVVIGFANGTFGTDWRTEMVDQVQEAFKEEQTNGIISSDSVLKIEHAGTDINKQIQEIRNMISEKVDVIVIEPNSATALNGVINEAKAANIPVVCADQAVTNPYAINVEVNHVVWGQTYAQWLATALNGKGNIVMIGGVAGNPAAVDRQKGAMAVFKKYPNIKVLEYTSGNWDEAKAQSTMSDLLAAYPKIDGVWVEDSMGLGVLKAFIAANRTLPVMTGDPVVGFFKLWNTYKGKLTTFVQTNPPGISASGIKIAVRIAIGKKLKTLDNNTFYYPITTTVTNDNFDEIYNKIKDQKDTYELSEYLTDEKADSLFES
jgi:ribose transport system substrate-binding protein